MAWYRITIRGTVQGVGFRPYIYRKASREGRKGQVKNKGSDVEIIIDDPAFLSRLTDLPPLAKIESSTIEETEMTQEPDGFSIQESEGAKGQAFIPPDISLCADCARELDDPSNRRHGHPFITCTDCGPRFTIIKGLPYDRKSTSMAGFALCERCRKEYNDPEDRRFHAETIACKDCGPRLSLRSHSRDATGKTDLETILKAVRALKSGETLSIKGVGGFHLCSTLSSVRKVRDILGRPDKPFAIMVRDLEMAAGLIRLDKKTEELLSSPERPIVVMEKKDPSSLKSVSELHTLGIMLPYTPLHHLLLKEIGEPLAMTSSNLPGEPVSLVEGLGNNILSHDREIVNRCDDSVIRMAGDIPIFLRRSRGYAPAPIRLPFRVPDTLALGAGQNIVICAAKGNDAFLSQYIGDAGKEAVFRFLEGTAESMIKMTGILPKIIACDLHPGYPTTAFAHRLAKRFDARVIQVQHHKAHVAAVAGEHGLSRYCGIALDGMGYGEDGSSWGGEVFLVDNGKTERIGSLEKRPQPGGDAAVMHPRQMLFGMLHHLPDHDLLEIFTQEEIRVQRKMIQEDYNTPYTSGTGRILDAASALLGLCTERTYEGRPAMLLEAFAREPYPLRPIITRKGEMKILMTSPLFSFLWENRKKDRSRLAGTVQRYLAEGLYSIARETGLPIVLSGGVAGNAAISSFLKGKGILLHTSLPPGDGCISFGQVICANR